MPSTPLPLAGIRRRLASMFYESLLLLGVFVVLLIPLVIFSAAFNTGLPVSILRAYVFLSLAWYFIWHWRRGQTLSMRTWHLRIVALDGATPSLGQLALRYVVAWPSVMLGGAGIIWSVFDRERQFLHDRLAGTRIISVPPTTTSTPPPAKT